jgi:hypothetical protein
MKRITAALIILFTVSIGSYGAVFADRNILFDPFETGSDFDRVYFTQVWGWGEFSRYVTQSDNMHFWDAKIGAYGEFLRIGNLFSIVMGSDLELISSSNSTIFFEPRAFFWQEEFLLFLKLDRYTLGLGYYHRCKHDVDNLNQYIRTGMYIARVSIYDSITLRWSIEPAVIDWGGGLHSSFKPFVRNHLFVITSDLTTTNYYPSDVRLTNLVNALEFGAYIKMLEWQGICLYLFPSVMINFYRADGKITAPIDWFLEGGIRFGGDDASLNLLFRYEHFFDAGIEPHRVAGDYWMIGLKVE